MMRAYFFFFFFFFMRAVNEILLFYFFFFFLFFFPLRGDDESLFPESHFCVRVSRSFLLSMSEFMCEMRRG